MNGDNHRNRELTKSAKQIELMANIKMVGRFIQEKFLRGLGESAGYLRSLLFPPREALP